MSTINLSLDNKKIGKVLFIVEGIKTEINILYRIFTNIFDYQYEKLDRLERYKPYNRKENPTSSIFVINTEESNIKDIKDANGYLDYIFIKLINEYDLDDFKNANLDIFNYQEKNYDKNKKYKLLSLICLALIDLGLVTIESESN